LSAKPEVDRLLAQAAASAQAGRREQAYKLLLNVVELDQYNETAWMWLSTVTDNLEDQRICLENTLTVNPDNALARERLASLGGNGYSASSGHIICPQCGAGHRNSVAECDVCGYTLLRRCPWCSNLNSVEARACGRCDASLTQGGSQALGSSRESPVATSSVVPASRPAAPIIIWPVVAFWVGASLFFLGGGILSLYRFAEILLYARGVLQNLSPIQAAWLPMGLFFLVFGFTGLSLAWQLAGRRSGGYYGSLVFGLVLTVLGPSASLVLEPPNYLATACTGLMPAAAVLLTLASMAGFES
jgi:hypothetical protein